MVNINLQLSDNAQKVKSSNLQKKLFLISLLLKTSLFSGNPAGIDFLSISPPLECNHYRNKCDNFRMQITVVRCSRQQSEYELKHMDKWRREAKWRTFCNDDQTAVLLTFLTTYGWIWAIKMISIPNYKLWSPLSVKTTNYSSFLWIWTAMLLRRQFARLV